MNGDEESNVTDLSSILREMREYSKTLQFERDDLSQKLTDARGDIKVRETRNVWAGLQLAACVIC